MLKTITACRSCHGEIKEVLRLGIQQMYGWFDDPAEKAIEAPLTLVVCTSCWLLQLQDSLDSSLLWNDSYGYKSGINQTMRDALGDIVVSTQRRLESPLKSGDVVVDIGSNDGTLLRNYPDEVTRIGFDPVSRLKAEAEVGDNLIIDDFFSISRYPDVPPAKVITAIAMFYDLDDPDLFVRDVATVLDMQGVFVVQLNYLPFMLFTNGYDNISHEHREFWSLRSMRDLFRRNDLEPFDVSLNEINGGSIRLYVAREGQRRISPMLRSVYAMEEALDLDTIGPYQQFAARVTGARIQLRNLIGHLKSEGKSIYGYGASTRGSVILQYCDLTDDHIDAIADRNPEKWGKYCAGSGIPVISEEEMRKADPDYLLILPWAFMDEFRRREQKYRESGGLFILPLPEVMVE